MINAAKELGRTVGYNPGHHAAAESGADPIQDVIVSGRFVILGTENDETVVKPAFGDLVNVDILGIAADDTEKLPYNGMYEVIDNFCKYGKIAAFVCGGLFTVWNDGRGAVFADDVETVAAGTPLYINEAGVLSTNAVTSSEDNIGVKVVGSVIKAPASADGTLFFKAKGL